MSRQLKSMGMIVLIGVSASGCTSSWFFDEPPRRELEVRAQNIFVDGEPFASFTSTRLRDDVARIEFRGEAEIRTSRTSEMKDPTEEPACLVFLPLCAVALGAEMVNSIQPYDSRMEACEGIIELQVNSKASYRVTLEPRVDELPLLVVGMRTSPFTRIEQELECAA